MKVALKQGAMPGTVTTQAFTDAVFSSDIKLLLPFFSRATANDTQTAHSNLSLGATDGTNMVAMSFDSGDALATTDNQTLAYGDRILGYADYSTNGLLAYANTPSFGATSASITWQTIENGELINALMLGGSDVEATVQSVTLSNTDEGGGVYRVQVTHNLAGGAPHVIIVFSHNDSTAGGAGYYSYGWYDVAGADYLCIAGRHVGGVGTSSLGTIMLTSAIAAEYTPLAKVYHVTVANVGATTFDLVGDASSTDVVRVICLRVTSGVFKVGAFTTKTSIGTNADITGMSSAPSLVLYLPTSLTALDTLQATTGADSIGFGVAVNNGGSTEQGSVLKVGDDNVSPSVEKSFTSATYAAMIGEGGSGAVVTKFSVSSWDSGGVTHQYAAADGSARYVGYLAIGGATGTTLADIKLTTYTDDTKLYMTWET